MKKYAYLLLGIGLLSVSQARAGSQSPTSRRTFSVPYTQKGEQVYDAQFAGADYLRITGTNEISVSSGPTVLYGIYLDTSAVTDYATFRDTDSANGSGTIVLGKVAFATTIQSNRNSLPFPVLFNNGITVQLTGANSGGPLTGQSATVIYRKVQ